MPTRLSAPATAGQESGSGQYPVDWVLTAAAATPTGTVGHPGHPPACLSRNERDLSGGEDIPPASESDVFTATRRQPEQAVEGNDEREGLAQFPGVSAGEPAVERLKRIHGNNVHRDDLAA
jgi:hypothetical protein